MKRESCCKVKQTKHSRRRFLAAALGAVAAPQVIPASALGKGEQVPLPPENIFEEELDAGIADAHGGRRPGRDVLAMDEVFE